MSYSNILFTGGSGLLGKEMVKLFPDARFPTSKQLDIRDPYNINTYLCNDEIDTVVHMAAYTDTVKTEVAPHEAIQTNIIGTANVALSCDSYKKRLIYISTDYVFSGDKGNYHEGDDLNPVNKYGWSKLGGEASVRLMKNSLIIRTSFCKNEFPYDKAFTDQYTSRTGVTEFALNLQKLILSDLVGIIHVGHSRRSVHQLATTLSPEKDIAECSIEDMSKFYRLPSDTSLNVGFFNFYTN